MAYVFDPINNTLIDDEDKSLGNKLGLMDGGRVNFANGNPNLTAAAKAANEAQKLKGLQPYIDNFGIEVLDTIAQDKYGKNFSDLSSTDLGNLKRRLMDYEDFVKQNNRMPNEEEARKFGRADRDKTIKITVKENQDHLSFEVIDEGMGIPKELLGSLFEPFSRARRSGTEGERSTGLGLSIVKKIIDAHNGKIRVNSMEEEGTCFSFTIPKNLQLS